MEKHINIVSFNIPYPANYGGVIDVYYKLMALRALGVKIILHCFEYERPRSRELERICERVFYYKRRTGLLTNLTHLPYNVYSRKDPLLIQHLLENDYPILFEGLHTCYYLGDPRLRHRMKIVRECNIEHDYYRYLAQSGKGFIRNLFFRIEAARFQTYEPVLRHANRIIAVSTTDAAYLRKRFPEQVVDFMPCFHENERITALPGLSWQIIRGGERTGGALPHRAGIPPLAIYVHNRGDESLATTHRGRQALSSYPHRGESRYGTHGKVNPPSANPYPDYFPKYGIETKTPE